MLTPDTTIIRSDQILQTAVGDEIVALDGEKGAYYGADGVAADILQMLDKQISVGEIVAQLIANYDVDQSQCEADVMAFLGDLLEKDVIKIIA